MLRKKRVGVAPVLFMLAGSASQAAATTPASKPSYPCHALRFAICLKASLVKPPAVIKEGATATFRGRVADRSKDFSYRISVSRGVPNAPIEITATKRSHEAVVYPSRRWRADAAGPYIVCVWGSDGVSPHPPAVVDCGNFSVQ